MALSCAWFFATTKTAIECWKFHLLLNRLFSKTFASKSTHLKSEYRVGQTELSSATPHNYKLSISQVFASTAFEIAKTAKHPTNTYLWQLSMFYIGIRRYSDMSMMTKTMDEPRAPVRWASSSTPRTHSASSSHVEQSDCLPAIALLIDQFKLNFQIIIKGDYRSKRKKEKYCTLVDRAPHGLVIGGSPPPVCVRVTHRNVTALFLFFQKTITFLIVYKWRDRSWAILSRCTKSPAYCIQLFLLLILFV